jgi:hypothetical protein
LVLEFQLPFLLLLGLEVEAFSADRHVQVATSNQLNLIACCCSESEACRVVANLADSLKLLYLFALWNQVKNVIEWLAERSTT